MIIFSLRLRFLVLSVLLVCVLGGAFATFEITGARFWTVLGMLMASLAICCLAGPVLRPAATTRPGTSVANLAILIPSLAYGAASCAIAALAASAAALGVLVTLQLVVTTVFALVLIGWNSGVERIEHDQEQHRAELSSYDEMCEAVELLMLDVSQSSDDLRAKLDRPILDLAEKVRYASTTVMTPELDQQILNAIRSLRRAVQSGQDEAIATEIMPNLRTVTAAIAEREIRARSSRRA